MTLYVAVSGLYVGADAFTLRQLAAQDDLDFTLVMMDPGYDDALPDRLAEFSASTGVPSIRVPYRVPPGGRCFDWGIWNGPFLLAESEDDMVLRMQSWRVVSGNLVSQIKRCGTNVGFVRQFSPEIEDVVGRRCDVSWRPDALGPRGAYGDWCLRVGDYLVVNGIDEPATMLFHFEDMDFELRWTNAVHKGLVGPSQMLSGAHYYLDFSRRPSAVGTDTGKSMSSARLQSPCLRCRMQWPELQACNNPNVRLADLANSEGMEDLGIYFGKRWFYCRVCDAPIFHVGSPHFAVSHQAGEHRATMGLLGRFGRNLRNARAKCIALPAEDRHRYVADSYWDADVLSSPDATP